MNENVPVAPWVRWQVRVGESEAWVCVGVGALKHRNVGYSASERGGVMR